MNRRLQDLTEDELTAHLRGNLRQRAQGIGIGDDCAVVEGNRLLKVDCVTEGRHYLPETSAIMVGRKAIARVMSDFAAMGGVPDSFLVTCGLRSSTPLAYITELYRGMDKICEELGGYIIGGETCAVPEGAPQFFSITGYGHCLGAPILRSGAKVMDLIFVTGALGNSFQSDHHLEFTPRLEAARWLVEKATPTAMMDLSDGLARDLPRITKASQVGYQIDQGVLPLRSGATTETALTDGEDYELLFTLSPEKATALAEAPFLVTQIGTVTETTLTPLVGGWDHLE